VPTVNRNAAFGLGALLGAATAFVWGRRSRRGRTPASPPATRRQELHEKLAEAKRAPVDERDFGAAGMGGETLVEDAAPPRPPAPPPPPPPEARPAPPPAPAGPPPADEFEAMRRRIHEEGKAAAEEMRSAPEQT
jgi:hypothetical protein